MVQDILFTPIITVVIFNIDGRAVFGKKGTAL
jgi:hypothetical protein